MTTTEPTARKPLDMDKLTLGEISTIESLSGQSMSDIGKDGVPMGKMLAALAMVAQRRNGFPKFQFGDALALTMEEAMEIVGLDDAPEGAPPSDGDDDTAEAPDEVGPTKPTKRKSPTTD